MNSTCRSPRVEPALIFDRGCPGPPRPALKGPTPIGASDWVVPATRTTQCQNPPSSRILRVWTHPKLLLRLHSTERTCCGVSQNHCPPERLPFFVENSRAEIGSENQPVGCPERTPHHTGWIDVSASLFNSGRHVANELALLNSRVPECSCAGRHCRTCHDGIPRTWNQWFLV